MIAHQVHEGLPVDERGRSVKGIPIAAGGRLLDERQRPCVVAGRLAVGGLAAGTHHHAYFLDTRGDDFFQNDLQGGFFDAVQIHKSLQRQAVLVGPRGSHDGSSDLHATLRSHCGSNLPRF